MGYRTIRGGTVHGIRISTLKKLLAKVFSTVDAAMVLGIPDPDISNLLRRLEGDEIVDYAGEIGGIEHWQSGRQGQRILGTKIAEPQTASKALQALDRLLDVADGIARDETASHLPVEIYLFGSVLRGGDADGLVGDLDVAVKSRRRLSGEAQRDLERAEHGGYIPLWKSGWAWRRMMSRLSRAVRIASVHEIDDVETIDAQRQLVWRFDRATQLSDRTRGPIIGTSIESPGPPSSRDGDYRSPPPLPAWRVPPEAVRAMHPPVSHRYRGALVDELSYISRHLWTRGRTVDEIAEHLHARADDVTVLLTWEGRTTPLAKAVADMAGIIEATLDADLPSGSLTLMVREAGGSEVFDLTMKGNVTADGEVPAGAFAPAMTLLHALRSHLPGHWSKRWRGTVTSVSCTIPIAGVIPVPEVEAIGRMLKPVVAARAQERIREEDREENERCYHALAHLTIAPGDAEMTMESMPRAHRDALVERLPVPDDLRRMREDPRIRSVSIRTVL